MTEPPTVAAPLKGLTSAEAAARARAGQANSVAWTSSRSFRRILLDNAATPINIILFIISGMLLALQLFGDAVLTAGLVLGNVAAGVFQETRAKQQLDRIALLNRPRALVLRDGVEQEIAPEAIVFGDHLLLRPGDQVFVDGVVLEANGLALDESLLTGESDLVPKREGDEVISGTYGMVGSGMYRATRIGADTTASRITATARQHRLPTTPLQREVGLVLWTMTAVVVVLGIVVSRSFLETDGGVPFREVVRAAAVIVALVPQGLAVMVTVSYAMAAVRMAGSGVLIQRMNAVESISHVDMLCLDKTGTLTTNRLVIETVVPFEGVNKAEVEELLGVFAASVSFRNRTADAVLEAFHRPARKPIDEVAFDSARKWSGLSLAGDELEGAYVLGAPEVLAAGVSTGAQLLDAANDWTAKGFRVLMFVRSPGSQRFARDGGEPVLPAPMAPLGLAVLRDETRPDAASVVNQFTDAGIELKIISGDNPDTVAALARQAGLSLTGEPVSGLDIGAKKDSEIDRLVREASVFGRVAPGDKERIVSALKRGGRYVAMVGDGVNDVPALKAANVAVALRSGSAVTRSIADMLLLDDAFSSLPRGFREGQRIRKGMESIFRLFLTRTLSLSLVILAVSLLNDPFPVSPRHTAVIAMLTVGIPSLFLAVWARPERTEKFVILSGAEFVLPAAISIAAVGLVVYEFFLSASNDTNLARTALTLTAIGCGLLLLPFLEPPSAAWVAANSASGDWRPTLLAAGMAMLFIAFLSIEPTRKFYELVLPDAWGFALIGLVIVAWAVILRSVWRGGALSRLRKTLTRSS
jgi:cation-transporting ATPase E